MTANLVITGCNAATPEGFGLAAFEKSLRTGRAAGAALLSGYVPGPSVAQIPPFDARALLATRTTGNFDRLTLIVCIAVKQLLEQMGLESSDKRGERLADDRISLTLGSSGPLQSIVSFDLQAIEEPAYVQPGIYPNVVLNVPASYAAIRHAIRGSCITLTDGETSSLQAFATAAAQIEAGRIDFAIVGGAEEATPAYQLYRRALAATGVQPEVLIEGAALLTLEPAEQAIRQGRRSLARLYGCTHVFAPGNLPGGIAQCLVHLRRRFGSALDEVSVICSDADVPLAGVLPQRTRLLSLTPQVGDSGAMHGSLAALQVLVDTSVQPGETALVLQCSREGACAALLLQKHAHAA